METWILYVIFFGAGFCTALAATAISKWRNRGVTISSQWSCVDHPVGETPPVPPSKTVLVCKLCGKESKRKQAVKPRRCNYRSGDGSPCKGLMITPEEWAARQATPGVETVDTPNVEVRDAD